MNRRTALVATFACLGLLVAGCSSSSSKSSGSSSDSSGTTTSSSSAAAATVTVTDPWARTTAAGATTGAIYLTLTASTDDKLMKAEVPTSVAAKTEIHEVVSASSSSGDMGSSGSSSSAMETTTTMATTTTAMATTTTGMGSSSSGAMGGAMTMRPVSSVDLPAGKAVTFKPGGYHIMLTGLVKPLTTGEKVQVTLTFEKAPSQTVTAVVREG